MRLAITAANSLVKLGCLLVFLGCSSSQQPNKEPFQQGVNDLVKPTTEKSAHQPNNESAKQFKTYINSIGMKLVRIPKGKFVMGSPDSEEKRFQDETQHDVTISRDFYMGAMEVTQEQWKKVMGENPSQFKGDQLPVESINSELAISFCNKLSNMTAEKVAGRIYRLPTEAEWEYACRAGSKTSYCFGDNSVPLSDYDWYADNSGIVKLDSGAKFKMPEDIKEYMSWLKDNNCQTHNVGQKKPNAWGLHDMHGNISEWCADYYDDYASRAEIDPKGPTEGSERVFRGGCWISGSSHCRSATRTRINPKQDSFLIGFRVVVDATEAP